MPDGYDVDDAELVPVLDKVPITILTGFLGAGKTSRLNQLLSASIERVAVIENEIGALGVDGAMVANRHDDGVIELTNGCLCCSAEVDLIAALEGLAGRRKLRPFDRVIIETTGLADVAPVLALLRDRTDPLFQSFICDGVVTVVDCLSFCRWAAKSQLVGSDSVIIGNDIPMTAWASGFGGVAAGAELLRAPNEDSQRLGRKAALTVFWKQIAAADRLVITKTDLAGDNNAKEVSDALTSLNPFAEVLLDSSAPDSQPLKIINSSSSFRGAQKRGRFCNSFLRGSDLRSRAGAAHLDGVEVLAFPIVTPMCADALRSLLLKVLADDDGRSSRICSEEQGEAWRIKGVVPIVGDGLCLIQGVGDQVEIEAWPHGLDSGTFLVIIGERLSRDAIDSALAECASPPQTALPG